MKKILILLVLFSTLPVFSETISAVTYTPNRSGQYRFLKINRDAIFRGGLVIPAPPSGYQWNNDVPQYEFQIDPGAGGPGVDGTIDLYNNTTANHYLVDEITGTNFNGYTQDGEVHAGRQSIEMYRAVFCGNNASGAPCGLQEITGSEFGQKTNLNDTTPVDVTLIGDANGNTAELDFSEDSFMKTLKQVTNEGKDPLARTRFKTGTIVKPNIFRIAAAANGKTIPLYDATIPTYDPDGEQLDWGNVTYGLNLIKGDIPYPKGYWKQKWWRFPDNEHRYCCCEKPVNNPASKIRHVMLDSSHNQNGYNSQSQWLSINITQSGCKFIWKKVQVETVGEETKFANVLALNGCSTSYNNIVPSLTNNYCECPAEEYNRTDEGCY